MIRISREDFDLCQMIREAGTGGTGGFVSFLGTVRDDGIDCMDLEVYEEVAEKELREIRNEAFQRFDILSVDIVHRVGRLKVGDQIVGIVVGASHRKAAFEACEYIIDRIKESVPIWKQEHTPSGSRWVPGEH
jgi:molybdopterin synthase catalytic subunit